MTEFNNVWVIGEASDSYAALCTVGRRLSSRVEALVVSEADTATAVLTCGADAVLHVSVQPGELMENAFEAVVDAACDRKPAVVIFSASKRMRLAAARLAAAMHTRVINDASRIWVEEGCLFAEHMVFGGSAYSVEKVQGSPAVLLVSEGLLATELPRDEAASEAPVEELPAVLKPAALHLREIKSRKVEAVNLVAARRVVSVGRGLEHEEDLQLMGDFAQVLDAELGCTRPIAEGVNWMSRERYIGVSGVMLKPDLFFAVGVSGQVQHMVGAVNAKTIVAVNKDKNAPVFKQADYGMVGDLYEVIPQLVAEFKA